MWVVKASGKMEKFNEKKLRRTIMRAGADKKTAEEVVKEVKRRSKDGITTKQILELALRVLDRKMPHVAARYDLKGSIMRLGPAGYIFEKYFAAILKEHGYLTRQHRMVKGSCVTHEIDVTADKEVRTEAYVKKLQHYMIELKFHHSPGIYTGLKESLYTYARFLDLQDGWKKGLCEKFDQPWLVCNTKFSSDAIRYANCKNVRLIGWAYPTREGLAEMIEAKKLYPLTSIKGVDSKILKKFSDANILLCKDILKIKIETLQQKTGLSRAKLQDFIKQAGNLCMGPKK